MSNKKMGVDAGEKIRVGIVGMGRLGRAVAAHIKSGPDRGRFELVTMFTRANIETAGDYVGRIDVMLVCVGSQNDAMRVTPGLAEKFSTVDSFDTHKEMKKYIDTINGTQKTGVSIVGVGWDPGLMSLARLYFSAVLPGARVQSFWGPGVSMGHTNAVRQISGVADAVQFTIPVIKRGTHRRLCYVVTKTSHNTRVGRVEITHAIKNMSNYFAGQKTTVRFVSARVFAKKYAGRMEHAGRVTAVDGDNNLEFLLRIKNNANFTAGVMLAYAVANHNMARRGLGGVFTVADVAPKYLFSDSEKLLGFI